MIALRHVLVPIDFSEPSLAAIDMAIDLARAFDARVTLLHVFEVSLYLYTAGPFMPITDTTNALEDAARHAIAQRLATVKKTYAATDAVVRGGPPWKEIVDAAVELKADLVVMGTHGRRGLPHAILGSVAERVVRMSSPITMATSTSRAVQEGRSSAYRFPSTRSETMAVKDSTKQKARILVVDDEATARSGLQKLLTQEGYAVDLAEDGAIALARATESPPDVVVTDLKMPNMDGIELTKRLHELDADLPVIVATAFGDVGTAVAAMRAGADDYLTKPIDFDALALALERALERRELRVEAENLRRQLRERDGDGLRGLIGASQAMQRVYRVARQVASSRATVLITGESGTGKGELARAIHDLGPRANKPFVQLHCASLAESLLESELFGHERGSFTGADKRRLGRFEQADNGTLFLDEVGEIPALTQVKLLQVLQERTFERVGGNEAIKVDVRVIAATNRDLAADVRDGRFREDLYYRLNVVHIEMPALRLRGGDVAVLANHFLKRFALENHKRVDGFTDAARTKIIGYRWPGNVRALENAIERAVVLCEGPLVDADDLPFEAAPEAHGAVRIPGATMAEIERYAIVKTLEATDGSTTKAADLLDISVRTIQYRLQEYGLAKSR